MLENAILKYKRYEDNKRVQDLGIAIVHTHSEFMGSACTKLWYYNYYKAYNTEGFRASLVYGSLFHLVIEEVINNRVLIDSEPSTNKYFLDILKTKKKELTDKISMNLNDQDFSLFDEEIDSCEQRIINVIDEWIKVWDEDILSRFNVIATEKVLIKPIKNIDGEQYKTSVIVDVLYDEDNKDIVMIQSDSAFTENKTALMDVPVYKIGTADVILQEKSSGHLYIMDHKTTGSVSSYKSRLKFDLQLQSYCNLLNYEINFGSMQEYKDCRVAGVIWDISSSKTPPIAKRLISGKLSTAKKSYPYWQYIKAIKEHNLNIEDYKEHINYLQDMSWKYVSIEEDVFSYEQLARIDHEDLIYSDRINSMREKLQRITHEDHADAIVARFPQCQAYNSCSFMSPCLANTPYSVILNEQAPVFSWLVIK